MSSLSCSFVLLFLLFFVNRYFPERIQRAQVYSTQPQFGSTNEYIRGAIIFWGGLSLSLARARAHDSTGGAGMAWRALDRARVILWDLARIRRTNLSSVFRFFRMLSHAILLTPEALSSLLSRSYFPYLQYPVSRDIKSTPD